MKNKIQRIVVAIDFSPISKNVIRSAIDFAKSGNIQLLFLHVIEPRLEFIIGDKNKIADVIKNADIQQATKKMKALVGTVRAKHKQLIVTGNPSVEIRKQAKKWQADLIFLGNHGKKGLARIFLGSISDSVARESTLPVWIVKGRPRQIRRIVIPFDGSEGSLETLRMALNFARRFKAKIQPICVVPYVFMPNLPNLGLDPNLYNKELFVSRKREIENLITKMATHDLIFPLLIQNGQAASDLPKIIKSTKADLVMMSSHARKGLGFTLLGKIAAHIIHHSPVSIFLIRPSGWQYKEV